MFGQLFFDKTDQALVLSNDWKKRGATLYADISNLIKNNTKTIESLISEEKDIDEKYFIEIEEMEKMLYELKDFMKKYLKDPLPLEVIKKLCEYELYVYQKIVTDEIQQQIKEELDMEKKLQDEIQKMFTEIDRMWDNGQNETDIKTFLYEKYKEIYPQFNESMLKFLSETIFLMATSGKKVRVNLNEEQIEKLVRTKGKIGTCGTCLEEVSENDEVVVLPCDDKHIFHENCIVPWLRMSVNCPTCRKDLRDFL